MLSTLIVSSKVFHGVLVIIIEPSLQCLSQTALLFLPENGTRYTLLMTAQGKKLGKHLEEYNLTR